MKYLVVAEPQIDNNSVPYVGPVADTVADAAEFWYLHVCAVQGWDNSLDGFVCSEHEAACDAYQFLARLSEAYRPYWCDILGERLSIAEVFVHGPYAKDVI